VPDLDSQLALAAELGVPEDQVRQGSWPQWLPDGDPVRVSFAWTQAGLSRPASRSLFVVGFR